MTFPAQVFRVFIASPSDLTEERDAATDVINAWNAQHAAAEGVVLLPVRWETHARPQSGTRPQQAINDQLVSKCDILLGMFWTRVGTSTGVAESGTIEEFDLFVAASKPALLYFSRRPIDPARIDAKQHAKLKTFKTQTLTKAFVGELAAREEYWEKVWWNRHMIWLEKLASGEDKLKESQKTIFATARKAARRIERNYGKKNLGWDTFDWGMVNGKLSALNWVLGDEWDFLDT